MNPKLAERTEPASKAPRPADVRRLEKPVPEQRTASRRSGAGADIGEVALEPSIFGIEPNQAVLHQVVTAQLAAARAGTQSTKTRAEVRGGGAKPYRQKGTGRARQGSSRSPQFIGGGVALGPKPRSYAQQTPKKMIRLALFSALSDRASEDRVIVVDQWGFEAPSTKEAVAFLEAIEISGRVLVVLGEMDGFAERSFANLQNVQTLVARELNAYDVLVNDWVIFTDETLPGEATVVAATESDAEPEAEEDETDATSDTADTPDTDEEDAS